MIRTACCIVLGAAAALLSGQAAVTGSWDRATFFMLITMWCETFVSNHVEE